MSETAQQNSAPSLSVNDLAAVANIIDLAVQRGAFRATEAKQVGETFERVAAFVQFVADQQKAEAEAKAKAEGQAPAETSAQ